MVPTCLLPGPGAKRRPRAPRVASSRQPAEENEIIAIVISLMSLGHRGNCLLLAGGTRCGKRRDDDAERGGDRYWIRPGDHEGGPADGRRRRLGRRHAERPPVRGAGLPREGAA